MAAEIARSFLHFVTNNWPDRNVITRNIRGRSFGYNAINTRHNAYINLTGSGILQGDKGNTVNAVPLWKCKPPMTPFPS